MPPLKPLFILLALSPALAADPGFGWKLDRGYKYLLIENGEKIGETVFRFTRKEGAAGAPEYYQLASRMKKESGGHIFDSSATTVFAKDGSPTSYHEEIRARQGSDKKFDHLQEVRIRFDNGKVTTTFVNNGNKIGASKNELAVSKDTFLFSSLRQEQWNLFTGKLDSKGPTSLEIYSMEVSKVVKIEFRPEVTSAPLKIGKKEIPVTRFSFEAKKWKWTGNIWVDSRGRMLKYTSGPLTIALTGKID